MKKCVIICNQHGGKGIKDEVLDRLKKILKENGFKATIEFTKCKNDATDIVFNLSNVDLVVSIGGDGTFSEVVRGNVRRKKSIKMIHLPNGTTNDVARSYGYNYDIYQNLYRSLIGNNIKVDVPSINGLPFIYVCGYGKFLDIPYVTPQKIKKLLGGFAYYYFGFIDYFKKLKTYDIDYFIDDDIHSTKSSIIVISNSTSIAGFKNFYNHIDIDLTDGLIEVALLNSKTRYKLLQTMIELVFGGAKKVKNATRYSVNKFKIRFNDLEHVKWDLDGEEVDMVGNEFVFEVNNRLNLMVPKSNKDI